MLLLAVVLLFGLFTIFVWREQVHDEREILHRMIAGRVAFFAGSGVLLFGIIVGELRHDLDPWLPAVLGIMIVAKATGLLYAKAYR